MPEVALRWLTHHSALDGRFGDGFIIGASQQAHLEQNMAARGQGCDEVDHAELCFPPKRININIR